MMVFGRSCAGQSCCGRRLLLEVEAAFRGGTFHWLNHLPWPTLQLGLRVTQFTQFLSPGTQDTVRLHIRILSAPFNFPLALL